MKPLSKRPVSAGDNETFVLLIQVAREDPEIRDQLLTILSLESLKRRSALCTLLKDLKLKQAPQEFVSAIACFLDDSVAEKALAILKDKDIKDTG